MYNNSMENKKNSAEFLNIYNEVDAAMRHWANFDENVSHMYVIDQLSLRRGVVGAHREELKLYARLRNAIIHNPYSESIDPIAEPHDEIVKRYAQLKDRVLNPPKVMSIAVPAQKIYSTTMEAKALEVIRIMDKKIYAYVPVLNQDSKIIGVFSEGAVFSYLAKNEICRIGANTLIAEFEEFIPLNNHAGESFEFVDPKTTLAEAQDLFEHGLTERKRLGVVYVTDSGKQNGQLLGMITAWDLAGSQKFKI